MDKNTGKNSTSMSDGLLVVIGFVSMTFLLFCMAFYMGREMGKNDKSKFEEYTKTLEADRNEMTVNLENLENKIGNLEFKVLELGGKIDEMSQKAEEEAIIGETAENSETE